MQDCAPMLSLDGKRRRAVWQGREYQLSKVEYRVLRLFVDNPYVPISREKIKAAVWNTREAIRDESVNGLVLRLRNRMFRDRLTDPIRAVIGVGYCFQPPANTAPIIKPKRWPQKVKLFPRAGRGVAIDTD
jgi:DNA-binding response OmpR family regulator